MGVWQGQAADKAMRNRLLGEAVAVAKIVKPELIKELTFTRGDYNNPAYQEIRRQMIDFGKTAGLKSIYSQTLRNDLILFGPENIATNSPMASQPGTVYKEYPPENMNVFRTGEPATCGPYHDEYGSFVSAFAPVKDPPTGNILLVVGVDQDAKNWGATLWKLRLVPVLISVVVAMLLLFLSWRLAVG